MNVQLVRQFAAVGLKRNYATAAAVARDFQTVFSSLDERMARSRLNRTNRNLVYRPKRSRDLQVRNESVPQADELSPKTWLGVPGKKGLKRCIKLISTPEEFSQVKNLIRDYSKHYPEMLTSEHISLLIRQAAIIGLYNEAVTFTGAEGLKGYRDVIATREQLRLHALRLKQTNGGDIKLDGIEKLSKQNSDDLEISLLKVVALDNLKAVSASDENNKIHDSLKQAIVNASDILKKVNVEQETAKFKRDNAANHYITLKLALDAFNSNGADVTALKSLADAAAKLLDKLDFVQNYVQNVEAGFAKELATPQQQTEEN